MPRSNNRTKWPVNGGAVAMQPGWFPGHATALIYVNMGLGEIPENMSHPVVSPFQISGPTNDPYPGTICLPQVPLPANISANIGDKATIQVVEIAKHGAALYNVCLAELSAQVALHLTMSLQCVDIEFADPQDPEIKDTVTRDNCFNSSDITFQYMYTTSGIGSGAAIVTPPQHTLLALAPLLLATLLGGLM